MFLIETVLIERFKDGKKSVLQTVSYQETGVFYYKWSFSFYEF